jgi:hypothetical protein
MCYAGSPVFLSPCHDLCSLIFQLQPLWVLFFSATLCVISYFRPHQFSRIMIGQW